MLAALVVGLGGTGSWALAHLKRRLLADSHWAQLAAGPEVMSRHDYDRNPFPVDLKALDVDKKKRPVLGALRLDASVEDISVSAPIGKAIEGIRDAGDGATAYPTIQSWLSQEEAAKYDLTDANTFMTEGAGQIRQFGRIAFFYELITNATELGKLDTAFSRLTRGNDVQIFVVASVAGGTGGGLLIDTLAYLQHMRQNLAGAVSVRSTGFVVLPGAFKGVVDKDEYERMQANGLGTLRELDRFMNAYESVELEWQAGRPVRLKAPVLDACYLLDGSRDLNEGPQLDGHEPFEEGLPAGIADAIYSHVFPSCGAALGRDYPNLSAVLVGGVPNRYSSFGTYSITYAWEPLMRTCGLRAIDALLDQLLADGRETGRPFMDQFLSTGATGSLAVGERQQQIPALATEGLASTPDPQTLVVPGTAWTEPRQGAAEVPVTPTLADRFPDISPFKRTYTNPQVVSEATKICDAFFGPREVVWDDQGKPAFHAAVNYNVEASGREWERALFIACAAIMNSGRKVAGISAAHELLVSLELRLKQFGDVLSRIPRPDLTAARQAVLDAEEEMNDGRTWDDYKEQRNWLQARQELLGQEVAEVAFQRTNEVVGKLRAITANVKGVVVVWREQMELLQRAAREQRAAIDKERESANESPLQRYVPLPGDSVEEALFGEFFGVGDGSSLPSGLVETLETVSWEVYEARDQPRTLLFKHPGATASVRPTEITLTNLEGTALAPFVELRTKSAFELLERAAETPEAIVGEFQKHGSRLAAYDVNKQLQNAQVAPNVRDWNYVFAAWPASGPGSELAGRVRARLSEAGLGITPEDLTVLRQSDQLPSSDKILAFSARHLMALDAFPGVQILDPAYRARRRHTPSPHVLPEERGAALLEELSEELAREGLVATPLGRLSPDAVALCADHVFLQYVAACAAGERMTYEALDPAAGTGRWVVARKEGKHELGTVRDLAQILSAILAGNGYEARNGRQAIHEAYTEVIQTTSGKESLQALALRGWARSGGDVSVTTEQLLRVAAAQLAEKL